jgi:hypothetical protein
MNIEDIESYSEGSKLENIWNGHIELAKILTLMDQQTLCKSIVKRSNAYYISYFKCYSETTAVSKMNDQITIEDKPSIILRSIKKRTEFYITFNELPELMELDFEKQDQSYGIRHWKWLGDPLNEVDFKRLGIYIDYICSQKIKKHVL